MITITHTDLGLAHQARAHGDPGMVAYATVAIECAERVLPIWEVEHPRDERPRRAIEAARDCLSTPCAKTQRRALEGAAKIFAAAYAICGSNPAHVSPAYAAAFAAADAAYLAANPASINNPLYAPLAAAAACYTAADPDAERMRQMDRLRQLIEESAP